MPEPQEQIEHEPMENNEMQKSPLKIELKDGNYLTTATDGLKITSLNIPTVDGKTYDLGDANNLVGIQIEHEGKIYSFQRQNEQITVVEDSKPKNINSDLKSNDGIFDVDGEKVTVKHVRDGEAEITRDSDNTKTTVSYRAKIKLSEHKIIVVNKENGKKIPYITLLKQFSL